MIKKIFHQFLLALPIILFLVFACEARAEGLEVIFETTPLFNEVNFAPGKALTKWVRITNRSGTPQRVALEAINVRDNDELADVLLLEIKEGEVIIFNNSLTAFFNSQEVQLSAIANNAFKQYDFTITFASESPNQYQGKTLSFDILVGFQGQEEKVSVGALSLGTYSSSKEKSPRDTDQDGQKDIEKQEEDVFGEFQDKDEALEKSDKKKLPPEFDDGKKTKDTISRETKTPKRPTIQSPIHVSTQLLNYPITPNSFGANLAEFFKKIPWWSLLILGIFIILVLKTKRE